MKSNANTKAIEVRARRAASGSLPGGELTLADITQWLRENRLDGNAHNLVVACNALNKAIALSTPPPPAAEPVAWRSMDSAPKDGTEILLMRSNRVGAAYWIEDNGQFTGWFGMTATWVEEDDIPAAWSPLPSPGRHWSDCAVNNGPAYEPGPCDCGGYTAPQHGGSPPAAEPRKLVMSNGDTLTCDYPDDQNWARSWTSTSPSGSVSTQEQDWEVVETYSLTDLFVAYRTALLPGAAEAKELREALEATLGAYRRARAAQGLSSTEIAALPVVQVASQALARAALAPPLGDAREAK